jgi:hypothetical protein
MKAEQLLRLYPRAWRDRYAEEFLGVVGDQPLNLQQAIDIVSGAIDAWLSADVKRAATSTGGTVTVRSIFVCQGTTRYTTRDSMIGASIMIAGTALLAALAIALRQSGWPTASAIVSNVAFLASLTLSMPFWLMKGQPWKAQLVIVGGTTTLLVLIAWLAQLT